MLTQWDRLFWVGLSQVWRDWRHALIFVQPDTVVRWQGERFRRYCARLSKSKGPRRGRPGRRASAANAIAAQIPSAIRAATYANSEYISIHSTVFDVQALRRKSPLLTPGRFHRRSGAARESTWRRDRFLRQPRRCPPAAVQGFWAGTPLEICCPPRQIRSADCSRRALCGACRGGCTVITINPTA